MLLEEKHCEGVRAQLILKQEGETNARDVKDGKCKRLAHPSANDEAVYNQIGRDDEDADCDHR